MILFRVCFLRAFLYNFSLISSKKIITPQKWAKSIFTNMRKTSKKTKTKTLLNAQATAFYWSTTNIDIHLLLFWAVGFLSPLPIPLSRERLILKAFRTTSTGKYICNKNIHHLVHQFQLVQFRSYFILIYYTFIL